MPNLQRKLLGCVPKELGDMFWNSEHVRDPAAFFVPPHSAYKSQIPQLFSETLKENILLGLPEEQVDLQTAMQTAVMEQDVADLEKDLDTMIGARGAKRCGGQALGT